MSDEVTIRTTKTAINQFFSFQEFLYSALGPAADDIFEGYEDTPKLDKFFEDLTLAVAEPTVLCGMCGSTTKTRCGRLGCV